MTATPYPYAIGQTKGGDTSTDAQEKVANSSRNNIMRGDVLGCFKHHGAQTVEDVAENTYFRHLWLSRYDNYGEYLQDCRRRCSELVKMGLIVDSGERKVNGKGNTTRSWKVAENGE